MFLKCKSNHNPCLKTSMFPRVFTKKKVQTTVWYSKPVNVLGLPTFSTHLILSSYFTLPIPPKFSSSISSFSPSSMCEDQNALYPTFLPKETQILKVKPISLISLRRFSVFLPCLHWALQYLSISIYLYYNTAYNRC